jgi:oligopeptide transport system permease protein
MSDRNLDNKFVRVELDALAAEKIDAPRYSYWKSVWRKFRSNKLAMFLLVVLALVFAFAYIQPLFSNYDYMDNTHVNDFGRRYLWPSLEFPFGTDKNGHSLFDVVWAGARTSISIGILATIVTTIIGITVGAIWGYSKKVDRVMIEVYNVISNVPTLLIVMVLAYAFGSGFWNLLFAMTVTTWIGTAYLIRVQVMIMRDREYNLASQCLGTPTHRMITKNILPYLISIIVTDIAGTLPSFISYEVFLSYLGVGLPASVPSLGRTISDYVMNMGTHPYLFWIPVGVLAIVTISLYIVGQALADASDPKTHM